MDLPSIDKINQDIDRQIQNDIREKPDLENVLRSAGDASGFNREEYPLMSELGISHIAEWRIQKRTPIPAVLLERLSELQCAYSCGFFEQVQRAWITIDRAIFLWNFEDGTDLSYFELPDEPIIACAMVNPRGRIVTSDFGEVQKVLVLATPSSFVLLGVLCRASSGESNLNVTFSEAHEVVINVLAEPLLRVSNEQVYATALCGTLSGRIMIGALDGHVYELQYELDAQTSRSGWFALPFTARRTHRLVCHTRSLLSGWLPLPSMLGGGRSGLRTDDSIVELAYEPTKALLFARAQRGTIYAFFLGSCWETTPAGPTAGRAEHGFERFATVSEGELRKAIARLTRNEAVGHVEVVRMHTVPMQESRSVALVLVTNAASRVYAAVRFSDAAALAIGHVRFATGLHIQHAALAGPQPAAASGRAFGYYPPVRAEPHASQGLALVGSLRNNCSFAYHADALTVLVSTAAFGSLGAPGRQLDSQLSDRVHFVSAALFDSAVPRGVRENVESFELDGRVWSVLLLRDHNRERVAVLTGESVTFFERASAMDCLAQLLAAVGSAFPRAGIHFDEVRAFAALRRADDAALLCLRIAASASASAALRDAALDCTRTLFGETRLLDAVRLFLARALRPLAGLRLLRFNSPEAGAESGDRRNALANELAHAMSAIDAKELDEPIADLRRLLALLRDSAFRRLVSCAGTGINTTLGTNTNGTTPGSASVGTALRDMDTFVEYAVNVLAFWRILARHNIHQILPYVTMITNPEIDVDSSMSTSDNSGAVSGQISPARNAASLWNYFALFGLFLPRRISKTGAVASASTSSNANANLIERLRTLSLGDLLVRERELLLTLVNALINHYMNAASATSTFLPSANVGMSSAGANVSSVLAPPVVGDSYSFGRAGVGASAHNTSVRAEMSLAYERDDALESISAQLERDCPLLFTRDDARLARAESLMHFAFALTNRELTELAADSPTGTLVMPTLGGSDTLQRVRAEKEQLVREAISCLKQVEVVERLDLERIIEQLIFVRCYSGAFELLEAVARRVDPHDRALVYLYSAEPAKVADDRRLFETRVAVCDYATRILAYLDRLSRAGAAQGDRDRSHLGESQPEKQSMWTSLLRLAESWSVGDLLRERFFRFATRSRVALERVGELGAVEAAQCIDFCLTLVRSSTDELLHTVVYEWFVRRDAPERLANFDSSPFLETYLLQAVRLVLLAEQRTPDCTVVRVIDPDLSDKRRCKVRYDAAWRYYERLGDQVAVSRVLACLADHAPTLSLDERIEYLSRAALRSASRAESNSATVTSKIGSTSSGLNASLNASRLGGTSKMALSFASAFGETLGASPTELASALEDKLQVALVQRSIQQELGRLRRVAIAELAQLSTSTAAASTSSTSSNNLRDLQRAIDESISQLDTELFDTSALYSEYAERFNLHEMRLALVRVSEFSDETVIGSIWEAIVAELMQPSFADATVELASRIGDSVARLYAAYGATELYFPFDYVLFLLESALTEQPNELLCTIEQCPCTTGNNRSFAVGAHTRGRFLVVLFGRRLHVSLARLADSYANLLSRCGILKEADVADQSAMVKRKAKRRAARLRTRIVQALVCIYEEFLSASQLVEKWDRTRFVQEGCDLLAALIVDMQSSADALNRSTRLTAHGTSMSDSFVDATLSTSDENAQLLARMRSVQQRLDALNN